MQRDDPSRRVVLKQLLSMGGLGLLASLRTPGYAFERPPPAAPEITGLSGKLIHKSDANYELWRQSMIWHASKPDRYPDMMVQAQNEEDVIAAINYAAEHGHKVAIRSGGHNSTGCSLRDGGMTLDLSAMDDLVIDEQAQVAYAQPGVRSQQMAFASFEKGLSFPVPHCPSVGLGGFTMGGGIGLNYPQQGGMATFSIVGAEIITAQGEKLLATPEQNPDLYWAVRGAGPGFFGAVTRLHFRLYPAAGAIRTSNYIYPIGQMDEALAALEGIFENKRVHDRVEVLTILTHHPEMPADAPPEESKILFVAVFAYEETESEALAMLEYFSRSDLSKKAVAKTENQTFDLGGLYDRYFSLEDPAGRMARYKVDNVVTDRGRETMMALKDHFLKAPSRDSHVLGGWGMKLRERKQDACFSALGDCFIGVYSIWDHEEDDAENYAWLRQASPLIQPFGGGFYINEIDGESGPDRYRRAFTPENWNRLQALRKQYDPKGVFHSYLGH